MNYSFKKYSSFCHFLPYHSHRSLSRVRLFATPRTIACQAPLSMGFSRQKCWSELLFPSPGDLPNPGIEPGSPALQADTLPSEPPGTTNKSRIRLWYEIFLHDICEFSISSATSSRKFYLFYHNNLYCVLCTLYLLILLAIFYDCLLVHFLEGKNCFLSFFCLQYLALCLEFKL